MISGVEVDRTLTFMGIKLPSKIMAFNFLLRGHLMLIFDILF